MVLAHIQYLRTKGKSQTLYKKCTVYYPLAVITYYCLLMPCGLDNEFQLAKYLSPVDGDSVRPLALLLSLESHKV